MGWNDGNATEGVPWPDRYMETHRLWWCGLMPKVALHLCCSVVVMMEIYLPSDHLWDTTDEWRRHYHLRRRCRGRRCSRRRRRRLDPTTDKSSLVEYNKKVFRYNCDHRSSISGHHANNKLRVCCATSAAEPDRSASTRAESNSSTTWLLFAFSISKYTRLVWIFTRLRYIFNIFFGIYSENMTPSTDDVCLWIYMSSIYIYMHFQPPFKFRENLTLRLSANDRRFVRRTHYRMNGVLMRLTPSRKKTTNF